MNQLPFPTLAAPSADVIARMTAVVGAAHALTQADAQQPHLTERRQLYQGRTPLVVRPGSTEEVSRLVAIANEAGVGIVPQGGNTGLVGGQIPSEGGTEIVLSLTRLTRIRSIDDSGTSLVAEAGVTLANVQAAAADQGRLFPLSMASEGSCTVGGNLATNAGGVAVLAYGTARSLVLGLEAVLADGSIWNGLRALKKDNTGYDLRDLLIGSEGTLGIITAATLRLFPAPRDTTTALLAVPDLDCLLPLFRLAEERAGSSLTACEFMSERIMDFVIRHTSGARLPFAAMSPWSVLIELSHPLEAGASALMEPLLEAASAAGLISDAAVAQSGTQQRELWRLREGASDAQRGEGGSIKHDVSVPVDKIPEFLRLANAEVERVCPGARPVPFGHFGDGNVHYNVSQPPGMDRDAFLALWVPMSSAVHGVVTSLGGSISAEHGIGRLKRAELATVKSATELNLMRRIKTAFDPKGILNPGKVL